MFHTSNIFTTSSPKLDETRITLSYVLSYFPPTPPALAQDFANNTVELELNILHSLSGKTSTSRKMSILCYTLDHHSLSIVLNIRVWFRLFVSLCSLPIVSSTLEQEEAA